MQLIKTLARGSTQFLFFFFLDLFKYSWFTMLCYFLLYSKVIQLYIHMHSFSHSFLLWFQFSSVAQSCPTLCDPLNCSTPGLPVHYQLPEFTQTHVYQVSDAIQPSHPLSSPSPPAPNPSQHQSLSNESTLHVRWPKYWSFSFSITPSSEHPGLISFRMDYTLAYSLSL